MVIMDYVSLKTDVSQRSSPGDAEDGQLASEGAKDRHAISSAISAASAASTLDTPQIVAPIADGTQADLRRRLSMGHVSS
jgi:hypothetical protein